MVYFLLPKWKGLYLSRIYFHWINLAILYILKLPCLSLAHPQKWCLESFTCYLSTSIFSTYLFYQRYLETGNYKGFFPTALQFLKQHFNLPDSNMLPWQIYTQKDVQLQSAKTSTFTSGNLLTHTHCHIN